MSTSASDAPRVSVVLPVYNTREYLQQCLDSVVSQDIEPGALELIAVDDGSTDGSGELLDEYAGRHGVIRVVHQENSGWPGQPRNRGIKASRGEYVFFLDSDDWLGPEALRRLCDYADAHGSDVVVPRLTWVSGRTGQQPLRKNLPDAGLTRLFKSLSPQKLFRRRFLAEHELRFPEGEVRLEDGIFVTRAYLLAARASMLRDYEYYFKRRRDDDENISLRRIDPEGYVGSLRQIATTVRELAEGPVGPSLTLQLYNRKGLTRLVKGRRFARSRRALFTAWVEALASFADEFVDERREARLPPKRRRLARAVRARDVDAAADAARKAAGPLRSRRNHAPTSGRNAARWYARKARKALGGG